MELNNLYGMIYPYVYTVKEKKDVALLCCFIILLHSPFHEIEDKYVVQGILIIKNYFCTNY